MVERDTAFRAIANTLPVVRAIAGPVIAHTLHSTPPEERSWKLGATVALLGATDKLDGILAREIGPTKLGGWLDQTADKMFVAPSMRALGQNHEISGAHFSLKVARDVAVSGMRAVAQQHGLQTDAGKWGKRKAFAEMTSMAAASSPVAAKTPWIIRSGFMTASGLSIISAIKYGSGYIKSAHKNMERK